MKGHPISKAKLNRCDANALLSLLLRYKDCYPAYFDPKYSLRIQIDGMREELKVPAPVDWEKTLLQVDGTIPKRIQIVVDTKQEYPIGNENTIPHIHCYPAGMHVKALIRTKVKRLNIVKKGFLVDEIEFVRGQISDNAELLAAVDNLIGR